MFNDFTPDYEFIGTSTLTPFEVWCQKILPTIYDNSLSYYELLNKVVKYLNDTMENVNNLQKDMTELNKAYQQLVTYINNFKNYTENELEKQNQEIVKLNNAWIAFKTEVDSAIAQIPEQIETKMDEYTASPAFASKVREAVDQSLQESGTLPEISEINSKIGNQTGSETVFSELSEINSKIGNQTGSETLFSELTEIKDKVTNINISGVDSIDEKIGNTGDSQGSATAGSVFAKLNLLIKAGAGSGSTDVNVQSIVDNIGTTADANATETAGTVFGKLNKIIGTVTGYLANYLQPISISVNSMDEKMGDATHSATRNTIFGKLAGLLSAINIFDNKVGTNTDTETGNTVFAKLNKIIKQNETPTGGLLGNGKAFTMINRLKDDNTVLKINGCGYANLKIVSLGYYDTPNKIVIDGSQLPISFNTIDSSLLTPIIWFNQSFQIIGDEINNNLYTNESGTPQGNAHGYIFYQPNN